MKKHLSFICIGFLTGLTVFLFVIFDKRSFMATLDAYHLLPRPEKFTELYFEDHLKLPKTYNANADNTFQFTVHNLEHESYTYDYIVESIATDSAQIILKGSFTLQHDKYKTVETAISSKDAVGRTQIQVSLPRKNQSIHFWVN